MNKWEVVLYSSLSIGFFGTIISDYMLANDGILGNTISARSDVISQKSIGSAILFAISYIIGHMFISSGYGFSHAYGILCGIFLSVLVYFSCYNICNGFIFFIGIFCGSFLWLNKGSFGE